MSLDFIDISEYEYKSENFFYNALNELKRNLDVIEIKDNKFVTKNKLTEMGVKEDEIKSFIKDVHYFALNQESYFNIYILKKYRIGKNIFRLGFNNIFYEELLKYSNKFEMQQYKGNILFTVNKVESSVFTDLVRQIIIDRKKIYRYQVKEIFQNDFNILNFNDTNILDFFDSKQETYYCNTIDMFFENEEEYLNTILRRD